MLDWLYLSAEVVYAPSFSTAPRSACVHPCPSRRQYESTTLMGYRIRCEWDSQPTISTMIVKEKSLL